MDLNRETILDELNDFEKSSNQISPVLEEYLSRIAKTGDTMFPWNKLKPLIRRKLEIVLSDFYENCPTDNLPPLPNVESFKYEIMRTKLLEALDSFLNAPFTIQRLCELVLNPRKHYKRTDKFMRGLEKCLISEDLNQGRTMTYPDQNILVVSTVEPKSPLQNEVNNNNAAMMVNGVITPNASDDSISVDNSNNNSSHSDKLSVKTTSTVNGEPPLDNFANVFSSVTHNVHASSELDISNSSQDHSFHDSEKVDSISSEENSDANEHLTKCVSSSDDRLSESAMDTSPDPSDTCVEVEVDSQETKEVAEPSTSVSATESTLTFVSSGTSEEEPTSSDITAVDTSVDALTEVEVFADVSDTSNQEKLADGSIDFHQEEEEDEICQPSENIVTDAEESTRPEEEDEGEGESEDIHHMVSSSQVDSCSSYDCTSSQTNNHSEDLVSQSHLDDTDEKPLDVKKENSEAQEQEIMEMDPPTTSNHQTNEAEEKSNSECVDSSEAEAMEQD